MKFLRILGLLSALTPVAYCVQLAFSLLDFVEPSGPGHPGSWWQHATESGLVPAIIGLGAVGLVFAIAFVFKLLGVVRSRPPGEPPIPRISQRPLAADGEADAKAMIARYLAKQPAESGSPGHAHRLPSAPVQGFGRRKG